MENMNKVYCKYCNAELYATDKQVAYDRRNHKGFVCQECKSKIAKKNSL